MQLWQWTFVYCSFGICQENLNPLLVKYALMAKSGNTGLQVSHPSIVHHEFWSSQLSFAVVASSDSAELKTMSVSSSDSSWVLTSWVGSNSFRFDRIATSLSTRSLVSLLRSLVCVIPNIDQFRSDAADVGGIW